MKRYIRSTTEYDLLLPAFKRGDDYKEREVVFDTIIADIVDMDGGVLIGDDSDPYYYCITKSIRPGGKYQLTEFKYEQPLGHQVSDSISQLLLNYSISHLPIYRLS